MTTESSMWKWLKPGADTNMKLERHENLVGVGAPDVWGYQLPRGSFWLELKQSKGPKDLSKKSGIKVRQSQKVWFQSMINKGCRTHWFLVQIGRGKYLVPGANVGLIERWETRSFEHYSVSDLTPREILEKAAKGF